MIESLSKERKTIPTIHADAENIEPDNVLQLLTFLLA
jgi:hypothetical protein